jgi:K(+)-stimulated pyrophosphate-energized sodium pump
VCAGVIEIGCIAAIIHILDLSWQIFAAVIIGLVAGFLIGTISEFFTSSAFPPTRTIAESSKVTAANVIISVGVCLGWFGCFCGCVCLCVGVSLSLSFFLSLPLFASRRMQPLTFCVPIFLFANPSLTHRV